MANSYLMPSLSRLGLAALLVVGSLSVATAQNLNYMAATAINIAGTYTDLGTTGTAIATVNTDDANSAAQNIGFTFNYNGTAYTQFTLNTNGFIKMGATAPSGTQLFLSETNTNLVDVFQSTADPNIIAPFNTDLTAGTSAAEYRVATTGNTGSRICTIQWKNVADKAGTSPTQYTNLSFQVKLYETGNIEFIYAAPTVGATSALRYSQVGLKGTDFDFGQLVQVSKASSDPWSAATFTTYVDVANSGFLTTLNFRSVAPPDAGRIFRFVAVPPCPTTPTAVTSFPYTENFDGVDSGFLPCSTQVLDANNDTYSWYVSNDNADSAPNALTYYYNDNDATVGANDWFFTPGLSLRAGYRYQLQFKYAAYDGSYPEGLEVKYGTAATPASQTSLLFSNTNIANETFVTTTQLPTITPTANGIYYIGFHAISAPDQYELFVDDIQVTETAVLAVRNANNSIFTAEAAPVPFGETLNIALNTLKAGPMQLTLRDALGRTVAQKTTATLPIGSSSVAVPEVGNLPAGVYFLNIAQGGATQVIRVAHQ